MKLTSLRLQDFRSYTDRTFDFDQGRIIFCGPNGIGKTNILEAISLLSVGKSWREQSPQDLIHRDADSALSTAITQDKNHWQVQITPRSRRFYKNEKAMPRSKFWGQIPTLLFCPEHLGLLTGPKSPRVMFFDRFLVQVDPHYRSALLRAHKAHKQKTALLRSLRAQERPLDQAGQLLAPWNQMLAESMPIITDIRTTVLNDLNPCLQQALDQLAPQTDPISLQLIPAEDIRMETSAILSWFDAHQAQEIAAGKNFIAPQRDDFGFYLRDRPLGSTASRGEVRSVLLSLLHAQKIYLQKHTHQAPILLLDDVFSELDDHRQAQLESLCQDCQAFFTTTHPEHFECFSDAVQVFEMN